MNETIAALVVWKEETAQNMNHLYLVIMGILVYCKYYFLSSFRFISRALRRTTLPHTVIQNVKSLTLN